MSDDWKGHDIMIGSQEIEHIHIKYPDHAYDCEAMAVDPFNGDILLFTKNHHHNESKVFKVPHGWDNPKTLEYVTTLPNNMLVTAADMSPTLSYSIFIIQYNTNHGLLADRIHLII